MADWPAVLRAQLVDAGLADGRVYWGSRPQAAPLPALVLSAIGGSIGTLVDGEADLRRSVVQADAWALSHQAAWALIEATINAVRPPFTRDGIRFASAGHGSPRILPDQAADQTNLFRATADLNFWHD